MNKQIALMAAVAIVITVLAGSVIAMDGSSAEGQDDVGVPDVRSTGNPTNTDELKAAISSASDGDTITLGGSFDITEQINVDKVLTIDLNSNELKITNTTTTSPAGFYFTKTCTISNGSIADERDNPPAKGWRILIATGSGVTLTISDVDITQKNSTSGTEEYNYAVRGNDGASLILEAGTSITSADDATDSTVKVVGVTVVGDNNGGPTSKLVVEPGVTIATSGFAISGNGTSTYGNVDIDINGGTITSYDSLAVYHPQVGNMTVDGDAVITGTTGIEMRAGNLTVNSGTITGTGAQTVCEPDGSGPTTSGVGIAIAQHTTQKQISVTVNGGNVSGNTAMLQSNPQNNPTESVQEIAISITGGSFDAINGGTKALDFQDNEVIDTSVRGGQYSTEVPSDYFDPDFNLWQNPDGSYQVAIEDPNQSYQPPAWDDDDDYIPPIVPSQTEDSGDDDTVTIVACAAAAVVAALLAAFLIIDRRP